MSNNESGGRPRAAGQRSGRGMRSERQGVKQEEKTRPSKPYQRQPNPAPGPVLRPGVAQPLSATVPGAPAMPAMPMQDLFTYFAAFTAMMQQQQQQQQQQLPQQPAATTTPQQPMMTPDAFIKAMAVMGGLMGGSPASVQNPEHSDRLTVKISQNRTPKGIAEDVLAAMQYGDPVIFCCGVGAINQAIKGVAVLRNNLLRDSGGRQDCCVWPYYRDEERNSLSLVIQGAAAEKREDAFNEMKVAGASEVGSVAGSISHRIRANEKVALLTMGPLAASSAVAAVVGARRNLKNDGLDVNFRPMFVTLEPQSGQESRSALQFRIYSQRLA